METYQIILILVVVAAVGILILPAFNRWQFKRLPYDQQVLTIMRQAKGLIYWKNISHGRTGSLFYVKNKRKILVYLGFWMKTAEWSFKKKTRLIFGIIRRIIPL